ncbi:uncharacterized protein LOC143917747 [Arctopsyche grandis]|uniref:uncharacterized protein LOC143917747 n=1 Tax=Arctopsyche grandis TaxID=121162 RepID=UPI00406D9893
MFVTSALISSDIQINYIDRQYNESGGQLGSSTKVIAEEVKNKIKFESSVNLIESISNIFGTVKCDNMISSMLSVLFKNLSNHMQIYDEPIKDNTIKNCLHNDTIKIFDDDDFSTVNTTVDTGTFDFTLTWISVLKSAVYEMDSFESFCDCKQIEKNHYNCLIYNRFLNGLKCSFDRMNSESADILNLTEIIEDLAQKRYNDCTMQLNFPSYLYNDYKPNPILQVLATTFRAIVEAIKIS